MNILLRCSWKSSLVSENIPKCFWVSDWVTTLLLKIKEGWDDFWILPEKITCWACLLGSGLKLIFDWKAQLLILFKSSFKFFANKSLSNITEKRNLLSVFSDKTKFSDKSFIYIQKSSGPRIEFWLFRTTLCFLSFRKSAKVFRNLPATPFCFNL